MSESRDGVLGVFNDVRIERGFEDALGAAFEDETNAPIIPDNQHSGWFELPELDVVPLLPDGAYSISEKAKAPAVLKRRLSFIGLVKRSLGPELQKSLKPGQGKEIHITDAIQLLINNKEKFVAHNFEGKYLDCGTMNGYINSSKEIEKI